MMAASTERFADYFGLQLRLAAVMAERKGLALRAALDLHTNLRRRFGLFEPDDPNWLAFLDEMDSVSTEAERLALTLAHHRGAPVVSRPAYQVAFGCFACDPPNEEGALRIHFMNTDVGAEPGPLSAARRGERLAELAGMFAFVRGEYPAAKQVIGGSWLYNLEAYRRLFPPAYGDSRRVPDGPVRLAGTSTWGQMVDHRGLVKPDQHARFLAGLETIDVDQPWLAFPLRAMTAAAPIETFFDFYGL
jgi:hypothetical protein